MHHRRQLGIVAAWRRVIEKHHNRGAGMAWRHRRSIIGIAARRRRRSAKAHHRNQRSA